MKEPKMIKKVSVDKMYRLILIIFGSVIVFIVLGIIAQLIIGALPSIKENGLMFLFKKDWDPNKNSF